ncbi:peptidoglycan DD-metalloendopeptidase family protein [Microbacterium ureisolvens]|uniref:Peptidoglycan DD-metalloendopeptidase family protein n=2 Tax=Microbacterium ureisolvens TaxID=2781186 RepID=A0ABS7I2G1_9MICO|nr:peptidoglycan DD-metalloendopeptidase family protein [Microbacterium ureisolvens]MBW9111847.1 peptidoglycan DD-metalloendopeptidase family protein [Microbacterium ureisolvens]
MQPENTTEKALAGDASVDCGCAPSPREQRRLWPSMNRRTALGLGILGVAALGAGGTLGPLVAPAFAADYPSWDDVVAAKNNEAAKAAEITKIQELIAGLEADVAAKQQVAQQMADEFYVAQQEYFDAAVRADQLQQQADEQASAAIDAANKAGRVAAQLYRNGGDDTSLELFFAGSASGADDLLARLGTMDKLVQRNQDVYAQAVTARDSAQSLSDQAAVQRAERDRLQKIAEEKMIAAQKAAEEAQAALDAQNAKRGELEAQLAALQDATAKTVADYQEGERVRAEQERLRREEEARRAKEEADRLAQQGGGGGGGGGGGSGGGGAVVGSGWARPSSGWRSSGYGPRTVQCGNSYCSSGFHYGVDLAAGCGSGIYAASAGRVVYAGWNGGYGNYIKIDHGGGIGTGYGHIRSGGIFVGVGQWVSAGQLIASEGNTGNSFGCHLHFETYVNGSPVNPIYFMADRGVSV